MHTDGTLFGTGVIGKLSDQSTMSVSDLLFEKISRQCRTKALSFEAIALVIGLQKPIISGHTKILSSCSD
jgi:hypothetical protein